MSSTTSPQKSRIETFIPLIAGGVGGTTGAIFTCPLEVVKTRLQSSNSGFPTCDGPSCDYVPIKSKRARNKLTVEYHKDGSGSGTADSIKKTGVRNYSTLTRNGSFAQDVKRLKYQINVAEFSTSEKTRLYVHTSNPLSSKSAAYQNSSAILSSTSTRDIGIRNVSNQYISTASTVQKVDKFYQQPAITTSNRHRHFKPWDIPTSTRCSSTNLQAPPKPPKAMNVFQCLRFIYLTEGVFGLWKGLGPNLLGVAPSRAIYFWAYSTSKKNINAMLPRKNRDTPFVHVISAMSAGFSASTTTNPIWLIKTRLQLDRATNKNRLTVKRTMIDIYKESGILGYWKGVTASYWGISETVIHFVIYEALKKQLAIYQNKRKGQEKTFIDFAGFMLCGACSKTCATCIAYPHEVARTRLREEGSRYKSFWQTLGIVYREEGRRGLYRGLATQLVRQIPNTAIMMSTYELTVYVLTKWFVQSPEQDPSKGQLKSDLRDNASDSNTSSAFSGNDTKNNSPGTAVTFKESHSQ